MLVDSSKANEGLSDSGLPVGWMLENLFNSNEKFRKALGDGKVKEVLAHDISGGNGFLSKVYRTSVVFDDSAKALYTFVMKVPTLEKAKVSLEGLPDDAMRKAQAEKMSEGMMKAHNGECEFYERFRDIQTIPLPEVWFTKQAEKDSTLPGVIMMEDLSEAACIGGMISSTSLDQIKNVTRHLATFHHYQLCVCKDDLKCLEGVDMHVNADLWNMFPALSEGFTQYDPEQLRPLVDKILVFANKAFADYTVVRRHTELGTLLVGPCKRFGSMHLGLPTVLCHGDLHRNNMLFYKNEEGTASDRIAAFIDWQSVIHGNPMLDLVRYVALCADAETRRESEKFIVKFYHDELVRLLEDSGSKLRDDITVEKLTEAYKLAIIHASMQSVFIAPFLEKANKAAGMDESQVDAETAVIVRRTKLLLTDALKAAEEVAASFMNATGDR
ncbi:Protein C04F6.7 [Aphelenchoides avenae]|nr:Protein C04F6.7 [Aphelenchus avenae]